MSKKHTKLTEAQKLLALSLKYYQGQEWKPKKGDYYTTSRNDLELYQIVGESEDSFYTRYCDRECVDQKWIKSNFLKNFGMKRVYVPIWILNA